MDKDQLQKLIDTTGATDELVTVGLTDQTVVWSNDLTDKLNQRVTGVEVTDIVFLSQSFYGIAHVSVRRLSDRLKPWVAMKLRRRDKTYPVAVNYSPNLEAWVDVAAEIRSYTQI